MEREKRRRKAGRHVERVKGAIIYKTWKKEQE